MTISPFYQDIEYITSDREDRITGVSAELSRPITHRLSASLDGRWEYEEFLSLNEDTTTYSLGSNLSYAVRSVTYP